MTYSRADIEAIIKYVEPNLTVDGIFIDKPEDFYSKYDHVDYAEEVKKKRDALLNNIEDFEKCILWLENKPKRLDFNWSANSLDLLALARESIGDVSHGALIAGAIYCGFKIRRVGSTTKVVFNMSHGAISD